MTLQKFAVLADHDLILVMRVHLLHVGGPGRQQHQPSCGHRGGRLAVQRQPQHRPVQLTRYIDELKIGFTSCRSMRDLLSGVQGTRHITWSTDRMRAQRSMPVSSAPYLCKELLRDAGGPVEAERQALARVAQVGAVHRKGQRQQPLLGRPHPQVVPQQRHVGCISATMCSVNEVAQGQSARARWFPGACKLGAVKPSHEGHFHSVCPWWQQATAATRIRRGPPEKSVTRSACEAMSVASTMPITVRRTKR